LKEDTTGEDIFGWTNVFFAENEKDWSPNTDISTDGDT
jgi:hypothetical protein